MEKSRGPAPYVHTCRTMYHEGRKKSKVKAAPNLKPLVTTPLYRSCASPRLGSSGADDDDCCSRSADCDDETDRPAGAADSAGDLRPCRPPGSPKRAGSAGKNFASATAGTSARDRPVRCCTGRSGCSIGGGCCDGPDSIADVATHFFGNRLAIAAATRCRADDRGNTPPVAPADGDDRIVAAAAVVADGGAD